MNIEAIVFYILLVDAISANLMVQFGSERYVRHFRTLSRWFPPAEGWALYYLALVCVGRLAPVPHRHAVLILTTTPDRPIFSGTSG